MDPWHLLDPRQAWAIVIVIAGLGFFNYVMLRHFGTRGVYYAAFLGGLILIAPPLPRGIPQPSQTSKMNPCHQRRCS